MFDAFVYFHTGLLFVSSASLLFSLACNLLSRHTFGDLNQKSDVVILISKVVSSTTGGDFTVPLLDERS